MRQQLARHVDERLVVADAQRRQQQVPHDEQGVKLEALAEHDEEQAQAHVVAESFARGQVHEARARVRVPPDGAQQHVGHDGLAVLVEAELEPDRRVAVRRADEREQRVQRQLARREHVLQRQEQVEVSLHVAEVAREHGEAHDDPVAVCVQHVGVPRASLPVGLEDRAQRGPLRRSLVLRHARGRHAAQRHAQRATPLDGT